MGGASSVGLVDLAKWKNVPIGVPYVAPGSWPSPTGGRIYVEGLSPRVLHAYDIPDGTLRLPPPAFTMELREPNRAPNQSTPTFTPDGRFLLFPSGRLISLTKDAKPAEPNPEP